MCVCVCVCQCETNSWWSTGDTRKCKCEGALIHLDLNQICKHTSVLFKPSNTLSCKHTLLFGSNTLSCKHTLLQTHSPANTHLFCSNLQTHSPVLGKTAQDQWALCTAALLPELQPASCFQICPIMADRKQGAGWSSGSSAAVHKAH